MTGRPVDAQRRQERQDAFLAAFARTGIITTAGEEAGVPGPQHHYWVKTDPEYGERFARAKAEAEAAGLADANRRPRARNGNYGGERGAVKKRNQEKLLEALRRCGIAIDAANEAGIAKATYNNWIRTDAGFAERAREALAAAEEARAKTVFERRSRAMSAAWDDPERRAEWGRRQRDELWTPERRAAESERQRQLAEDPAVREARSRAARTAWDKPGSHERKSQQMRDQWQDPDFRALMAEKMAAPEAREARSRAARQYWAALLPEQRKKRLKGMRAVMKGGYRLTMLEAAVMVALNERELPYFVHMPVDGFIADILVPSLKLVIECDGAYYHGQRNGTDETRDADLAALGYETVRLSEAEIKAKDWARLDETIARLSRTSA